MIKINKAGIIPQNKKDILYKMPKFDFSETPKVFNAD